jgi:hypothetical protein
MAGAARDRRPRAAKETDVSRVEAGRLADLEDVLGEVRTWSGVDDRGGGTFYARRKPFLHFHAGRDYRRADVRRDAGWLEIELPEPATAQVKRKFLAVLRAEYASR